MRIVSLLPSATEILFAIGAGDAVVGVTFECDFPSEARTRAIVSTTTLPAGLTPAEIDAEVRARLAAGEDLYRLDEDALRDLDPDIVVTQDLCAVCAVDVGEVNEALAYLGCRAEVVTVDPATLDEVVASIGQLGAATGMDDAASRLVVELQRRLDAVRSSVADRRPPRVAMLEWSDPPFAPGHWLPDMVVAAGGESVLGAAGQRSYSIEWADVERAQPEVVVVAPCGYRLPEASALAEQLISDERMPRGVPVWAVDADAAFVRPGPRLVDGVEALAGIFHPGCAPARSDLAAMINR